MKSIVAVYLLRWHFGIILLRVHVNDLVSVVAEMLSRPAVSVLLVVAIVVAVANGEQFKGLEFVVESM
jgi:hypothetical protein